MKTIRIRRRKITKTSKGTKTMKNKKTMKRRKGGENENNIGIEKEKIEEQGNEINDDNDKGVVIVNVKKEKNGCSITKNNNTNRYYFQQDGENIFSFTFNDKELLATGWYSKVYSCNKIGCSNKYSLKIMKKNDKNYEKEIKTEIAFLNIIKENDDLKRFALEYFYFCKTDVEYYLFTEKLDMNLHDYIYKDETETGYNDKDVSFICSELIKGLELFHTKYPIYHRDIQPKNIMIIKNKGKVVKVKYINFNQSCNDRKYKCNTIKEYKMFSSNDITLQNKDRFSLGLTIFELINKEHYYYVYHSRAEEEGKLTVRRIQSFFHNDFLDHYEKNRVDNTKRENQIIKLIEEINNSKGSNEEKLEYIPVGTLINYKSTENYKNIKYKYKSNFDKIQNLYNNGLDKMKKFINRDNTSNTIRLGNNEENDNFSSRKSDNKIYKNREKEENDNFGRESMI